VDDFHPRAQLVVERAAGAESCPDARGLSDAVGARLGYEPFADAAELRIRVRFGRSDCALRGTVEAFDREGTPKGEKKIESKRGDCGEVAQAVTLTIAILLDPKTGLVKPPSETKPEPDPLAPPPPPEKPPEPPPAPPPSIVPRVRVSAIGSVGAEPAASIAGRVAIGVAVRRFSVDAELRADLPRDATANDKKVTTGLLLGALALCIRSGIAEGCVVGSAGALSSDAEKGSPKNDSSFHLAVGPRLGVVVPLTGILSLQAYGEVPFVLTRTTVHVDGDEVWTTPLVSALLGLGLEVRFP